MKKFPRHQVKIVSVEDEFVIFDFGKFAFIVLIAEDGQSQSYAYPEKHYGCCFKRFCKMHIDETICCKDFPVIIGHDYQRARKIAAKSENCVVTGRIHKFVKEIFPDYFHLFVR